MIAITNVLVFAESNYLDRSTLLDSDSFTSLSHMTFSYWKSSLSDTKLCLLRAFLGTQVSGKTSWLINLPRKFYSPPTLSTTTLTCLLKMLFDCRYFQARRVQLGLNQDPSWFFCHGPLESPELLWTCSNISFTLYCSYQELCKDVNLETLVTGWQFSMHQEFMCEIPRDMLS